MPTTCGEPQYPTRTRPCIKFYSANVLAYLRLGLTVPSEVPEARSCRNPCFEWQLIHHQHTHGLTRDRAFSCRSTVFWRTTLVASNHGDTIDICLHIES